MRFLLLLWMIVSYCTVGISQNGVRIDSLENALLTRTKDSSEKIDLLHEIAKLQFKKAPDMAFSRSKEALDIARRINCITCELASLSLMAKASKQLNNYDEAILLLEEAIALEEEVENDYRIGIAAYDLGKIYRDLGRDSLAISRLMKSREIFMRLGNDENLGIVLRKLGSIHKGKGNFETAVTYYQEALDRSVLLKDSFAIVKTWVHLGNLYQKMTHLDVALNYYMDAKKYYEAKKDQPNIASSYHSLGQNYFYRNSFDEAESYALESLALKKTLGLSNKLGSTQLLLGLIYKEKKQYSLSRTFLDSALNAFTLDRKENIAVVKRSMGDLFLAQKNYSQAIPNYKESLKLFREQKQEPNIRDVLHNLSVVYEKKGNYKEAMKYLTEYKITRDGLDAKHLKALEYANRYTTVKHDLALERSKNETIQKEKELQESDLRHQKLISWLYLCLLFIFSILFFAFRQRSHRKLAEKDLELKQRELEEMLKDVELNYTYARIEGIDEERERIARELHDNLGSMLSTVKLYFNMMGKKVLASKQQDSFKKGNELLDKTCEEVRRISHNMETGVSSFGLKTMLHRLVDYINETKEIEVELHLGDLGEPISTHRETNVYRIVQELVCNAVRHADASKLTISLNRYNGTMNVLIEDDGKGFNPEKVVKKSGMGLSGVKTRVKKLGGTINIDTGKGVGTSISMDLKTS